MTLDFFRAVFKMFGYRIEPINDGVQSSGLITQFQGGQSLKPSKPELIPEFDREDISALERRLEIAQTTDECRAVCDEAPEGHDLIDRALSRALALAETFDDLTSLLNDYSHDTEFEQEILRKAIRILSSDLASAMTLEKCFDVDSSYGELPEEVDEKFRDDIIRKALELARTSEECEQVREHFYESDYPDSELEELVYRKMISLYETVGECQEIWDTYEVDTDIGHIAICKAADIIRMKAEKKVASVVSAVPVSTESVEV